MEVERFLEELGVDAHAAVTLTAAASRPRGMTVLCGSAGAGKTTIAQIIATGLKLPIGAWAGDLRMPGEIAAALKTASREAVIAVVRSGESRKLRQRWSDMDLADALIDSASVVTVTVRRFATSASLVAEVLAPDGTSLTRSLAEQARALVFAGRITHEEARFMVPGYD